MTLDIRNNAGIPLGSYLPGTGGGSSGGGGSSSGGGSTGADLSNYYTKPEIDEKFEAIDALVSELNGSKSEYVDLLNELNGDV